MSSFLSFIKNNNSKDNYKSFHMHGWIYELFDDPVKLIIVAGLVLVNLISFTAAQQYFIPVKFNSVKVLGQATWHDQSSSQDLNIYRFTLKALITDYLTTRSDYLSKLSNNELSKQDLNSWQQLLLELNREVFKLKVPAKYQDLHLKIAVVIMTEADLFKLPLTSLEYKTISNQWKEILVEYPWLND